MKEYTNQNLNPLQRYILSRGNHRIDKNEIEKKKKKKNMKETRYQSP